MRETDERFGIFTEEELKTEEWRPWIQNPNILISNLGRAYNSKFKRWVGAKSGSYLNIRNKNGKTIGLHVAVYETFVGEIPKGMMVNHLDECTTKELKLPMNNRVSNLQLTDMRGNLTYGTAIERRVKNTDWEAVVAKHDYVVISEKRTANTDYVAVSEKLTNHPLKSKKVLQFTKDGQLVREWSSTRECGRNGFNHGSVAACCRNCFNREDNNIYKGFIWQYA